MGWSGALPRAWTLEERRKLSEQGDFWAEYKARMNEVTTCKVEEVMKSIGQLSNPRTTLNIDLQNVRNPRHQPSCTSRKFGYLTI